jgi:hypothetical protein
MRHKIVTVAVAGVFGATSLAIAGPALAETTAPGTTTTATSPVDRIKEALNGLVSDKTLTQAQADKVASTLASADLGGGRGGPGGRGGRGPGLAAAATALKMTEADLHTALHEGKSLAQVAKDKGVSVDTLIAALVKAEKERIAQDVADGRLTQAEADQRLADVTERVTERVNRTHPARPDASTEQKQGSTSTPTPSATATS